MKKLKDKEDNKLEVKQEIALELPKVEVTIEPEKEEITPNIKSSPILNQIKTIERDELGLIKSLEYKYTEEGLVDWRALIPVKYLYINNDPRNRAKLEKKYNKSYEQIDILNDKVADSDLIISLAGLKFLGRIRGITEVKEEIKTSNENYASVTSIVTYGGNFETEMRTITFSASASATLENTTSFYQKYLVEAASNRAFARNIRNQLSINIVSREELGATVSEDESPKVSVTPKKQIEMLQTLMDAKHVTFDNITKKLKDANQWDDKYKSISDLPAEIIFDLLERLKKYKT